MKVIFLTGGVYSSLGKGVMLSSIGKVLQFEGFRCNVLKFDPYLNYNSRYLSPLQHGEVFVTKDGEETDLDLGHYERFLGIELESNSCITTGKVYHSLLKKERTGYYGGETVQIVPHLTQEIISKLKYFEEKDTEILLIELGGTVSDLEQRPFLLAAAQLKNEKKRNDMIFVHIAPILSLEYNGERKTKPVQHSLSLLKEVGISPDLLILKVDSELNECELSKINSNFPTISRENILSAPYQLGIYEVPLYLHRKENLFPKLAFLLDLQHRNNQDKQLKLKHWDNFVQQSKLPKKFSLKATIVGKYSTSRESYYSIIQSLEFASQNLSVDLEIKIIQSENLTSEAQLEGTNLVCIPPGFGSKSLSGIFLAIKFARERKIPFLGICFGMQLSIIEYFRNVLKIPEANSLEIDPDTKFPILIPWTEKKEMRLGDREITFVKESQLGKIYSNEVRRVRHRNRYIFNLELAEKNSKVRESELIFSAWADKILEGIELKNHPFFIGVQYHPEFNSRPLNPEPLFSSLVNAALQQNYLI